MIVAIGGSAGSIDALRDVLAPLPATTGAKIAIVVHVSPSHPSLLAPVLSSYTRLPVVEAVDKLPASPGTIVVAPPDYHLLVERGGWFALSRDPAVHFSRPAIDHLFHSAARSRDHLVGILLSGGNDDGAAGLQKIQQVGGKVAVQDPATCASREMPNAALARLTPDLVGSPAAIGHWLATLTAEVVR